MALSVEALEHFKEEAHKKVAMGQAMIVDWDRIKDNPPSNESIANCGNLAQIKSI